MDRQKTLETVARHLFEQGVRSVEMPYDMNGGDCLYRGPDGLTCAIGCLIPDELYDPDMERNSVNDVLETHPALKTQLGATDYLDVSMLLALQRVHDTVYFWESTEMMRSGLSAVASEFRLQGHFLQELSFKDR